VAGVLLVKQIGHYLMQKRKSRPLLMAGDEVKFIPVSLKEFQKM
jgi:hypothetical protein